MRNLILLPRRAAVKLIEFYQTMLSPDHSALKDLRPYGFCRFEPTCSQYGKDIIERRGIIIGGFMLAIRLCKCNPWKKPSPEKIMAASQSG